MSIRFRLILLVLSSIILTATIITASLLHTTTQTHYHEKLEKVAAIQLSISVLRTYVDNHERYRDENSIQQAVAQQARLTQALEDYPQGEGDEQIYLNSIHHINSSLAFIYSEMLNTHRHEQYTAQQISIHHHLLDRLNNSLLSMSEDGFRLAQRTLDNARRHTERDSLILGFLLFGLTLLTSFIAIRTLAVFRNSIAKLHQGIATTSAGNLGEHIRIPYRNELNDLASSYNQMQDNLRASMISIDTLQQEVKARTAEIEAQKNALKKIAEHDSLTGLPNRRYFLEMLRQTLARCTRSGDKAAIFFLDLDKFKQINDSLGHDVGDEVLLEMSRRFQSRLRQSDFLARIGGDEFTIIIDPLESTDDAAILASQLLKSLSPPCQIGEHTLHLHSSIGISIFPNDGHDPFSLMKHADSAMYKAKQAGGDQFLFYNRQMTEEALNRIQLESDLRVALKEHQLTVHYQPQFDLSDGSICGIEALVRWHHPRQGLIMPDKFIPLAEDRGLIYELGEQVMDITFPQFRAWKQQHPCGRLAINLSALQLSRGNLPEIIKHKLALHKLAGSSLELEITESHLIQDPEQTIEQLKRLQKMGIHISIDDFGTGYSSLTYLKRLPLAKLKIDKSFVDGIAEDIEDKSICQTIIALARSLQLDVIAEGVETAEQATELLQEGCIQVQGYYYSKPLSAKHFTQKYIEQREIKEEF